MSLPLSGVTVLGLTRVLAGPYATMVLGDLGADVIKVERLPGGDESRAMGPFRDGESYCFAQVNRNKRGVALDLKHPDGLKALLALAARSDVPVENFRPGTTERLGCGRIDAARAAETGLVDILTDDLDAELADFLDALRAADMPTLLAIRDTIRQVR